MTYMVVSEILPHLITPVPIILHFTAPGPVIIVSHLIAIPYLIKPAIKTLSLAKTTSLTKTLSLAKTIP